MAKACTTTLKRTRTSKSSNSDSETNSPDVKAYADFPKEIQDRRKKLWPKLKQAREDGKVAFFDKREPDKLYINGILST